LLERQQIDPIALGHLLGGLFAPGQQHVLDELPLIGFTHAGFIHRRLLRCWQP